MKLLNITLKVRGQADTKDTKDRKLNLKAFSLYAFEDRFFSNLV
jgi:hypothetical protein